MRALLGAIGLTMLTSYHVGNWRKLQLDEWIWSASIRMCFVNQSIKFESTLDFKVQMWHVSSRVFKSVYMADLWAIFFLFLIFSFS